MSETAVNFHIPPLSPLNKHKADSVNNRRDRYLCACAYVDTCRWIYWTTFSEVFYSWFIGATRMNGRCLYGFLELLWSSDLFASNREIVYFGKLQTSLWSTVH